MSPRTQQQVDSIAARLDTRQKKQQTAEKEVEQFEQRKQLEENSVVVDVLQRYARYQEVYAEMQGAKADRNRLENEVKELEAKNRPFKDSKEWVPSLASILGARRGLSC